VKLPLSSTTNSKVVQALDSTAQSGPFGQKLEQTVNAARTKIASMVNSLSKSTNPDALVNGTTDSLTVGNQIKTSFNNAEKVYQDTRSQLYEAATPLVKDAPAVLDNTRQTLDDIINQTKLSKDPTEQKYTKFYQQLRNNLSTAEPRTFENVKATRTSIGKKLGNYTDPITSGDTSNLKRLYAALSDDLDKTVAQHNPQAAEALQAASDYYKEGIGKFNSTLGKKIANSQKPELLVNQLVRPGEVTQIANLKNLVDPETLDQVKTVFLSDFLDQSKGVNGEVNAARLSKNINRYSRDTLNAILGPDTMSKLDSLHQQTLLNDIVKQSMVNGEVSAPKL